MRRRTWATLLGGVTILLSCGDGIFGLRAGPILQLRPCRVDAAIPVPSLPMTPNTVVQGAGQFPVVVSVGPQIAVVFRGRGGHITIDGRLDVAVSSDRGVTWPRRTVAAEGPPDMRNPAFGASRGSLFLAYADYDSFDAAGNWIPEVAQLTSFLKISDDTGTSWWPPHPLSVEPFQWSSPYGRVLDTGRELLLSLYGGYLPVYQDRGKPLERQGFFTFVLRSSDHGATWSPPQVVSQGFAELALLALSPGEVVGAQRDATSQSLEIVRWTPDAGWSRECEVSEAKEAPGDLVSLGPNRVLLVYGMRHQPWGIGARLSRDGGRSWSTPFQLVQDGEEGVDMGYPSTVVLGDSLLTLYYLDRGSPDIVQGRVLRELRYAIPILP